MVQKTKIERISIGGWFQRTTLHLSEMYDFLKYASSPLTLDPDRMRTLREKIAPEEIEMHLGELDHVTFRTHENVIVTMYEDGLIVLQIDKVDDSIKDEIQLLINLYEENIAPAFTYLFSLGAPVPKELADIKTTYPYFVVMQKQRKAVIQGLFEELGEEMHYTVEKKTFQIFRGDKLYVINNIKESSKFIDDFIAELIFTREFRGQLHRYLNIHRIIWERIEDVKERGRIKGRDVAPFKTKIEQYSKSINLIMTRIDQMETYIATRGKIAHIHLSETELINVVGFRYETLLNTLIYVRHIWTMTLNYVRSADRVFGDLQNATTSKSIESLTIVTSMGVGAALIDLFNTEKPEFNYYGIVYVVILATIGYSVSRIMGWWSMSRTYEVEVDDLNITE